MLYENYDSSLFEKGASVMARLTTFTGCWRSFSHEKTGMKFSWAYARWMAPARSLPTQSNDYSALQKQHGSF